MAAKNEFTGTEEFQALPWSAWMNALEENWILRITATQAEYQEERIRLREKYRGIQGQDTNLAHPK